MMNISTLLTESLTLEKSIYVGVLLVVAPLILLWRKRNYYASLPLYDEIPGSTLKKIANKKVLAELSGKTDVAIIGSGVGALTSAAILSKCGYKVVVFEQHYTVGGSTHMYTDGVYEFDVGVHYVGGHLDRWASPFRMMFNMLSDGQLKWARIDETFDVAYNATTDERIEITGDPKLNRKRLLSHFSKLDAKALDRYYRKARWARAIAAVVFALKAFPPFLLKLLWPLLSPVYHKFCLRKTNSVLKECGLPDDVIGAINYKYGDFGTPPGQSPFFMQACVDGHYDGGAFFPKGGSQSIAKTLVAAITRRGGHVFAVSPVESILTEKTVFGSHRAVGVRVHGVDVFVRKCVISNAGFNRTFASTKPLVSPEAGASQLSLLRDKENNLPFHASPAFFYLFVGLDGTDEELELTAQNVWHIKDWDEQAAVDKLLAAETVTDIRVEDTPLVFVSNESAKDPDYSKRNPGKSTVTLVAWSKYEWFKAWTNTTHGERGQDYEQAKEEMTRFLLSVFYKHFPKTKGRVAFSELGTPLSSNKYLGRETGEIYNLDHDVSRFESLAAQLALHPQTKVKNLFLTGQDVLAVSIVGATMSGFFAAGRASSFAFVLYCIPAALTMVPYLFFSCFWSN